MEILCSGHSIESPQGTLEILIIAGVFISIIICHKDGGGCLLEATMFDNSWKNFKIFKFSSDDRHIDIWNGSIYEL